MIDDFKKEMLKLQNINKQQTQFISNLEEEKERMAKQIEEIEGTLKLKFDELVDMENKLNEA